MIIEVFVKPGAKNDEVSELKPGFYRVSTTARAVENQANFAVLDLLSEHLGIPRSRMRIKSGRGFRTKLIEIAE